MTKSKESRMKFSFYVWPIGYIHAEVFDRVGNELVCGYRFDQSEVGSVPDNPSQRFYVGYDSEWKGELRHYRMRF